MINGRAATSAGSFSPGVLLRGALAFLTFLALSIAAANSQTQPQRSAPGLPVHVTHVLGFENVPRNARGDLLIEGDDLRFQRNGSSTAQISLGSIRSIFVGGEDRQVGGMPLTLGKAAVPFGGGRVVSLFSHKKYDSVALEYRDANGGQHAAIFRFSEREGEIFKMDLVARGAQSVARSEDPGAVRHTREDSLHSQKWSVQVDRVDPGGTALDPCFSSAIYENLLRELPKSKQFKEVLRSADRSASDSSAVLLLKTSVEHYSPGSETRRAVTTVTGATKIKVHIELVTSDGHVVLERTVEGNVRFIGDNLKATNKVASQTAKLLQRATLPARASLIQQATAKEAETTI
jgi:hypothetical protein